MKALLDLVECHMIAGDLDPNRIAQKSFRQFCHCIIHGRRKHHGLSVARGEGRDFIHILAETHIEHPIGFIQHQQLKPGEIQPSPFQVVYQPAGGCDYQVNWLGKELQLFAVRHAAQDGSASYAHEFPVTADGICYLVGQFTGRSQHQNARPPGIIPGRFAQKLQCRQNKSGGLAGARLGRGDEIVSGQCQGYGLFLDRCGG